MLYTDIIRTLSKVEGIEQITLTLFNYWKDQKPIVIITIKTSSTHKLIEFDDARLIVSKDAFDSTHIQISFEDIGGFKGLIQLHNWSINLLPIFKHEVIANAICYTYYLDESLVNALT